MEPVQPAHDRPVRTARLHYGWIVAGVTFLTLLTAAGVRAMPAILMVPFEKEFGWSRSAISTVASIQILLYGFVGPFAAGFMERFGLRRTVVAALALLALSLGLTPFMQTFWQFCAVWGLLSGIGTGALANVLGATVASRWFAERRGLVVGLLTASASTGQLVFLPLLTLVTVHAGWRDAVWTAALALAVIIPPVILLMRDRPADIGLRPYGAAQDQPPPARRHPFLEPIIALRDASRTLPFWLLAGTFFFCGFSTNGLIGTHLIAMCGDYGIAAVTAAGLLAFMGLLDLVGTTASGWLSDRFDNRKLLFWYYGLRGLSLLFLPAALQMGPMQLTIFAVFYGLDWIATVPPTVKLTSNLYGPARAGMVFGWIAAAHQLGASAAAFSAGWVRDSYGSYTVSFALAGFFCLFAALMALRINSAKAAALPIAS